MAWLGAVGSNDRPLTSDVESLFDLMKPGRLCEDLASFLVKSCTESRMIRSGGVSSVAHKYLALG